MLKTPTAHFLRHYAEMVLAMFAGMLVLELTPWNPQTAEPLLLGMATAMTIPMVAWMRHRGHGWAASWEMSAAMYVPTLAALALGWTGVLEGAHAQMGVQHVVMFPAMLAVMLLRREEYTAHAHEPAHPAAIEARA